MQTPPTKQRNILRKLFSLSDLTNAFSGKFTQDEEEDVTLKQEATTTNKRT